jgi:hypothetical protein
MNYNFGVKNNWRRMMWNRIVERLSVPPRDAVVLYLAGESDLDRKVAISKGFRSRNLIAVEMDERIATMLRNSGTLTVCGGIDLAVGYWANQPVHVVLADFCSGFTQSPCQLLMNLATNRFFSDSVVAMNLLRGRDRWNRKDSPTEINEAMNRRIIGTHRARAAFNYQADYLKDIIVYEPLVCPPGFVTEAELNAFLLQRADIEQHSYMSTSGQVFDSAVWRNCSLTGILAWRVRDTNSKGRQLGMKQIDIDAALYGKSAIKDAPIARQILAIRATRTRLLNQ